MRLRLLKKETVVKMRFSLQLESIEMEKLREHEADELKRVGQELDAETNETRTRG